MVLMKLFDNLLTKPEKHLCRFWRAITLLISRNLKKKNRIFTNNLSFSFQKPKNLIFKNIKVEIKRSFSQSKCHLNNDTSNFPFFNYVTIATKKGYACFPLAENKLGGNFEQSDWLSGKERPEKTLHQFFGAPFTPQWKTNFKVFLIWQRSIGTVCSLLWTCMVLDIIRFAEFLFYLG